MFDMERGANFEINMNQEVWMYDNHIGNYFRFDNIFDAKFQTEMSINDIHELCELKEYKRSTLRRFVFAYTKEECETKVLFVYS